MRTLALVLAASAALAVPVAPVSAAPCTDLVLRTCLDMLVNMDKVRDLCVPPDAADPFGC